MPYTWTLALTATAFLLLFLGEQQHCRQILYIKLDAVWPVPGSQQQLS
jgi:steroid 5-alpha reductase family enzyme